MSPASDVALMIKFLIERPKLSILLSMVLIVAGTFAGIRMRKEAFPTVNFAQATITTFYPGATPEDVEELVTQKIEDELREIDGLKEVRSVSQNSRSEVKIKVDLDNVDVAAVMDEIQRANEQVEDLPAEIEDRPKFQEIKTQNLPILEVALEGEVPELVLRQLADKLEDILLIQPGVASIEKIGYRDREFRVFLNPEKMKQLHISFREAVAAVQNRSVDLPGGDFESRPLKKTIRTSGEVQDAHELLDTVIRTNYSGGVVLLSDVGETENSFEDAEVLASSHTKRAIILVVAKKDQADIIDTSRNLKKVLRDFEAKQIPKGVEIKISDDESLRVNRRLGIVLSNSLIGFGLVLLTLMIFLHWRTGLVTSLSMPITIFATLAIMQALGITFNLISMLAIIIALGMLVDNSIVVAENIHRFQEEGMPLDQAAYQGVKEIVWPITATVLTTIAAFAPMMVTKGIMGEFIFSIPVLVSAALIISLLESFYILPGRLMAFEKGKLKKHGDHWFQVIQESFVKVLRCLVRLRWLTLVVLIGALMGAFLWAKHRMDFILFPPEGVDRIVIRYEGPPGIPIEDLFTKAKEYEAEVLKLPEEELLAVNNRTGLQQVDISDPLSRKGDNVGMLIIYLTDENKRERTASQIIDAIRPKMKPEFPVMKVLFEEGINGPPVGRAVTVAVLGQDLEELKSISGEIQEYLKTIPGVFDISTDLVPGPEEYLIKLKPRASADFGLTYGDVAFAIRTAHEGTIATTATQYGDEIDIRVLFNEKRRGNEAILKKMLISDKNGNLIPLEKVADISLGAGPEERRHLDFQRSITVTADVKTEVNTSVKVNGILRDKFKDLGDKHPGYFLKFGGEEESTQESMESLFAALIIAVLCIFAILVTLFNSFFKPFIIMFTIPFGFIGTIVGFSIHQKPLGFMAMIGVIGLAGVVVNASIVMVSFIDQLREKGELSLHECLIQGTGLRLRPVLLTTITTVSALLPTAYGIGGWDPLLVPLTLALAWGLFFGTLQTLVLVPCSYAAIEDIFGLWRKVVASVKRPAAT